MKRDLVRSLVAEGIGTSALVFAGWGLLMVDAKTHQLGHVGVVITFGLVVMFGIYAGGHISGAHFIAAVTFASLGNIANVGTTLVSASQGQAFLWELVMTGFLMFVTLAVATDTHAVGEAAAIAIGGAIGLDAMFGSGLAYQFVRGEQTRPGEPREPLADEAA